MSHALYVDVCGDWPAVAALDLCAKLRRSQLVLSSWLAVVCTTTRSHVPLALLCVKLRRSQMVLWIWLAVVCTTTRDLPCRTLCCDDATVLLTVVWLLPLLGDAVG